MDLKEWTLEDLVEEFNRLEGLKGDEGAILNELAHRLHCVPRYRNAKKREDAVFLLNYEIRRQFNEPDVYGNEPNIMLRLAGQGGEAEDAEGV